MTAPFKSGDMVLCIKTRRHYVVEGGHYIVDRVTQDADGTYYVSVLDVIGRHRAERFELLQEGVPQTPVIRKIKQLERRYKERMAA